MKFQCNRKSLLEKFQLAAAVASPKSPKPILQNVLLQAKKDCLELYATDLEVGIITRVGNVIPEEVGRIVVPTNRMLSILRENPDEEIKMELTPTGNNPFVLSIICADSGYRILCENPDEFLFGDQDFSDISSDEGLCLSAETVREMIRRCIFATDVENLRYALNGVLITTEKKAFCMVATDGRRLAFVRERLKKDAVPSVFPDVIVPRKALNELSKALVAAEDVSFLVRDGQILMRAGDCLLISKLLEGKFPPYSEVIPQDNDKKAVAPTQALLSAVRRAAILTSELSNAVDLSFATGRLEVSSRSAESGEAKISMTLAYEGPDVTVSFNPSFLIDFLKVVDKGEVTIEMKDSRTQVALKSGADYTCVVMPVVPREDVGVA